MKFECHFSGCRNIKSTGALRIEFDVTQDIRSEVAAYLLRMEGKNLHITLSDAKGFTEQDMKDLRSQAHIVLCQYAAQRSIDWVLLKKELMGTLFPGCEKFHDLKGEELTSFIDSVTANLGGKNEV